MSEREIFIAALAVEEVAARKELLVRECGGDAVLQARIETLLRAHDLLEAAPNEATSGYTPVGALQSMPSQLAGTMIADKYKLRQKLGIGGMGEVWMAEQLQPVKRQVAIKLIKAGMDSSSITARFDQERQALALMDHPNIARVLDAGLTEQHRPFFVMELVKGIPITKFCDQEHLTPRQRLELFIPVCQAVQHAHQKGIIHRDLKPGNILIALYDGKPVPKVIDFGVAKAVHHKLTDQSMFTEIGSIIGTLEYMAPEQAELNSLDIDTRADIYSLGVILYELLAGSPPFSSQQLRSAAFTEMLRFIREVEPPKPSTKLSSSVELPSIAANRKLEPQRLRHIIAGDLDWIVMKALEKDRSRRYETANGFAMDVQRYLSDEPVSAGPPGAGYRLQKFVKRNKGKVFAASLVLLALIVGMAGTTFGLLSAERQRMEAETARSHEEDQRRLAEAQQQRAEEGEKRAEIARSRAEEQAAIVLAVNEFLQDDLIGQADTDVQARAGQSVDREVSVLVLLDRAARRVGEKFADKPAIEAAVRQTIGETYRKLGRREEGLPHMIRSLELYRKLLPPDALDTLKAMNNLALMYLDLARYSEAEALFNEALAGYMRVLGEEANPTQSVAGNLARIYEFQKKYQQAEQLLTRRYEISRRLNGEDHSITAIACHNLADLQRVQGKYEVALPLTLRALEGFRKCYGPDHSGTMSAMNNLAVVYVQTNRSDQAEPIMVELLASRRRIQGDNHPRTISAMANLAAVYTTLRRYDDAVTLLQDALARSRRVEGEDHPVTLHILGNYTGVLGSLNRHREREPLLRELKEKYDRRDGADSHKSISTMVNLGDCLLHLGKWEDAASQLRQGLSRLEKLSPDHWTVFRTQYLLGATLLEQKNYAEAGPLLIKGYSGMKSREKTIPDREKSDLLDALNRLIQLCTETNKPEEVKKWQAEKDKLGKTPLSK